MVEYGVAKNKTVVTRSGWWAWDKTRADIPDIVYAVYKFSKPVNARIKQYSDGYIHLTAGSSYTNSYTVVKGTKLSYETSVTDELTLKQNISAELLVGGLSYAGATLGGKVSSTSEVQSKVSSTVKRIQEETYSETRTISYTVAAPTQGYYSYEKRANFVLYVIQVYSINYTETSRRANTWYQNIYYNYATSSYKLTEQNTKYTYIPDTVNTGIYKYSLDFNGRFVYADTKSYNIVYY